MSKSKNKTYFSIPINGVKKGNNYRLSYWYTYSKAHKNIDISTLMKFSITTQKYETMYLRPVVNKKLDLNTHLYGNEEWKQVAMNIKIPEDAAPKNNFTIYVNYGILPADKMYFTNFTFIQVLPKVPEFPVTRDLQLLYLATHYRLNSKTWMDESGNGNDGIFQMTPYVNANAHSSINTKSNSIKSSIASKIFGNISTKFTILFYFSTEQHNAPNELVTVLKVPGNQNTCIEIKMNVKAGLISCSFDDNNYILSTGPNKHLVFGSNLIAVSYDSKTGNCAILQGGVEIVKGIYKNKLLPSPQENIEINPNKNLVINLQGFMIYNDILSNNNYKELNDYFLKNNRKTNNEISTFGFQTDTQVIPSSSPHATDPSEGVDNLDMNYSPYEIQDDMPTKIPDQKKKCIKDCHERCNPFKGKKDQYRLCQERLCKEDVKSCKLYCSNEGSSLDKMCTYNSSCPEVYMKDGQFHVLIKNGSHFAKNGMSGGIFIWIR